MDKPHKVIIVGGGAGGLELATRLGRRLGKKGKAEVTLIDQSRTHIWKPLLHEVAAGTMDSCEDKLECLAQARWHSFRFRLGRMSGLDREKREVLVINTTIQKFQNLLLATMKIEAELTILLRNKKSAQLLDGQVKNAQE